MSGPEWEVENLYRLLIRVRRSLIRVDADELTYPVHIMLRYELENEMLKGELEGARICRRRGTRGMQDRLGVRPANDAEGCLQDVHWAVGSFGYFPSYAIGAVIAGQLYESLRADRPELDERDRGRAISPACSTGCAQNVHCVGATVGMPELMRKATGKPLSAAACCATSKRKYLEE